MSGLRIVAIPRPFTRDYLHIAIKRDCILWHVLYGNGGGKAHLTMTTEFIASLDAEIARLQLVVERFPEVRQLTELKRVRALYAGERPRSVIATGTSIYSTWSATTGAAITAGPTAVATATTLTTTPGRKMAPERQRALELVTMLLSTADAPVRTISLAGALAQQGINIGGTDPVNSLSALLSTSGQFLAHGRSGWTLKMGPKIEPNPDAPSEPGNGHNPMNG